MIKIKDIKTNVVSGIYKIENTVTKKRYVGSSKDIAKRAYHHFHMLKNNKHKNNPMQNAYNKYGESKFKLSILEEVADSRLYEVEQTYLDADFDNLYNIAKVSAGSVSSNVENALLLLNLSGDVVQEFSSTFESRLIYKGINTNHISKMKYRIVTPDFYLNNREVVDSWK